MKKKTEKKKKSRKYKMVLNSCKEPKCKRLCFFNKKGGKVEYQCSIFGNYFLSNCERKRI